MFYRGLRNTIIKYIYVELQMHRKDAVFIERIFLYNNYQNNLYTKVESKINSWFSEKTRKLCRKDVIIKTRNYLNR